MLCLFESSIIIICGCSPVSSLTVGLLGSSPNQTEVQLAKACLGLTGAGISSYVYILSVCMFLSGDTTATIGTPT